MAKEIKINLIIDDKEISAKILNADKLVNQLRTSATKTSDVFLKWSVLTTGFNQALSLGRQVFSVANQMIQPFLAFEKGMANVQSIIRVSQDDFKALSEDTLNLQKDLGLTSDELTGALYQIVSAGVPAGDAIKFLDISARSAIAGLTDTQTAADGLTTVVNAFKYEMEDTEKVADIMFNTVKLGKTTFEELSASLSEVAPIASSSGVSFEEVSGAIATLTKQGVPTSVAVTQIRASIIALNDILGDGWTETMSYQEAVQLLNEKAGASPKKLKEMIGRVEGVNAVLGLTGKNLKMAADDLDSMGYASGEMGKAFAVNSDTMDRKIAKLSESFNVLLIKSVGAIEPLLTGAIEAGNNLVGNIEKIGSALGKLTEKIDPELLKWFIAMGTYGLSEFGKGSRIAADDFNMVNQEFKEGYDLLGLGIVKWGTWESVATNALSGIGEGLKNNRKELESLLTKVGETGVKTPTGGTKETEEQKKASLKAEEESTARRMELWSAEQKLSELINQEAIKAMDELNDYAEESMQNESDRMIELSELKIELFEEDKLRNEEEMFQNETLYYSREELLNKQIELEQKNYNIIKQLGNAETADEFEQLKKQKQIVDKRIQAIKQEVEARKIAASQMIMAGMQQYDASQSLGVQMNRMANESIRRIIAEAVITQIAKAIAMIPFPFNVVLAPLAGLALQALLERFIPKFATGGMIAGKRHSVGGELINAEGGEFVVNREATSSNIGLLEAINSGRNVAASGGGSNADVIAAIIGLGKRVENLRVIAKLSPREFDEDYSNYLLKKGHTG